MSLFPYMFRDMIRPLRMMENHMRMTEELVRQSFDTPMLTTRFRNRPVFAYQEDCESVLHDKDKFQVKINVQTFKPEEITVKTLDGNAIQIEAKHEEKQENEGFISRQLVRRFVLPKGHELKDVVSSLSSDGVLTVTAPKKMLEMAEEKVIPISHTGPEKPDKGEEKKDV